MVKNYNENAFNELVNTINKHIDGDSSALPVLVDMITEVDKKYPMLKNKFIQLHSIIKICVIFPSFNPQL